MSELWFYRMFGEEFGPVPLESLQELATVGTIHADDSVRSSTSGWVAAGSVAALGLGAGIGSSAVAVATSPTPTSMSVVADAWFCRIMDEEFGPLTFDELVRFAEHEHLGADDEVKLGRDGKWRRAGSIGRLMAVLPYVEHPAQGRADAVGSTDATASTDAAGPSDAAVTPAKPQRVVSPLEAIKAEADAAYRQAEEQAQAQLAWAGSPQVDRSWWYWLAGVETGPVDLNRVVSLAYAGQLQPTDYVRNGQFGQYIPASSVPGLYAAIQILQTASETRRQVLIQAQAAATAAAAAAAPVRPAAQSAAPVVTAKSQPAAPVAAQQPVASQQPVAVAPSSPVTPAAAATPARAKSDPSITAPAAAAPVAAAPARPEPVPETPAEPVSRPQPMSSGSGFGSSSYSTPAAAPRPVAPARPVRRSEPILPRIMELFKGPQAQGVAAIVAVVLLYVGWNFLPKSRGADIKHYTTLKTLLDEIRAKRGSSPGELPGIAKKLEEAGKEIAAYMKDRASRDDFAKQCLLWASRDEVPKMIMAGLEKESPSEVNFETRLKEASYEMGLAKRPPVAVSQAQASTSPGSAASNPNVD